MLNTESRGVSCIISDVSYHLLARELFLIFDPVHGHKACATLKEDKLNMSENAPADVARREGNTSILQYYALSRTGCWQKETSNL